MELLPKEIENIVYDYKNQMEYLSFRETMLSLKIERKDITKSKRLSKNKCKEILKIYNDTYGYKKNNLKYVGYSERIDIVRYRILKILEQHQLKMWLYLWSEKCCIEDINYTNYFHNHCIDLPK